jgi:transmembrane sensor
MAGGGSVVALDGGSRLILDRAKARFAELAAGEASFAIRHDSDHPFVVLAGNRRINDPETTFNIVHDGDRLVVEVIEGAVRYDPHEAAISLTAGQTPAIEERGESPLVGRRDPNAIAGLRHGRLSYRGEPLARVARDLTRSLGARAPVDPGAAAMPFTGSVRVAGGARTVLAGFAASLGMEARRDGSGWRIGLVSRAPR